MSDDMEDKIKSLIRQERSKTIESIQNVELDRILDRLHIAIELGINEPDILINSYLYGYIERSFRFRRGSLFEEIALLVSDGTEFQGKEGDIIIEREGEKYLLDIKATFPSNRSLSVSRRMRNFQDIEDINEDIKPIVCFVYGDEENISDGIIEEKGIQVLAGQEFWEFLSGEDDYYNRIIDWMEDVIESQEYSLGTVLLNKRRELLQIWGQRFGQDSVYDVFRKES